MSAVPPDISELRELIRAIHEDRASQKEKEKRESWTRHVSLMVVFLAVATAIGSLKSGGYSSRVMLNQAKASDAWAFYQSKSIKERLAEMEVRLVPERKDELAKDVERYRTETAQIKKDAESFEVVRDEAATHGPPLGFGIATLQIAIALSSVCLITKKKALWAASGALGAFGAAWLVYGLYWVGGA
jgi:hypothetical protein